MLQLGNAVLRFSEANPQYPSPEDVPFEIHAYAALTLEAPSQFGYRGRSHSLWYCDADEQNRFGWYEMAFMNNSFVAPPGPVATYAMQPAEGARAISPGVDVVQLARNLKHLEPGELDEFIARWGDWLAAAWRGDWSLPSLPDEPIVKAWRKQ